MPRKAARRRIPATAPPPIWRRFPWRGALRAGLAIAGLAAAIALTLVLEHLAFWRGLNAALQSLDFDPARADLILAWLAAVIVAGVGAALSGRPWIAVLTATAFVGITYIWPLGDRFASQVPQIFGIKYLVVPSALHQNQATMAGVALLASIPAAATGDFLRRSVARIGGAIWSLLSASPLAGYRLRQSLAGPLLTLAGAALLAVTLAGSLVLAAGVDPLLRYGPTHGVYQPPVLPPRTIVDPAAPSAPPEVIPTHGQVVTRTYHSNAMQEDRTYIVYLPPSYGLRAALRRHYPVLYLLHGDPGAPIDWVVIGAPGLFDVGIASGSLPETILVLPDGNGHVTTATQWADRYDGRDRIEDAVLELTNVVDLEYRTVPDREHRLIAGLSSGAFGATNIAARHPDVFGVAMSFSGYFVAYGPVFGGNSDYIRNNSPYYLVQDQPAARTVRYIVVVGGRDSYYLARAQAFAGQLARLGVSYNLNIVPGGGHSSDVWTSGLALGMQRVASAAQPVLVPRRRNGAV